MALLSVIRRWHFREGMPIREIERRNKVVGMFVHGHTTPEAGQEVQTQLSRGKIPLDFTSNRSIGRCMNRGRSNRPQP